MRTSRAKSRRIKGEEDLEAFYRVTGAGLRFPPLLPAQMLDRPNRFLVRARLAGRTVRVACRDPGRLAGVLRPGSRLQLARAARPGRATDYDLVLARHCGRWVGVIPALANDLLAAALEAGGLPGLEDARLVAREVPRGRSRFDFLVDRSGRSTLLEVKSVAWRRSGIACFPDAPTRRGARHLEELIALRRRGGAAAVVFVAQRGDVAAVAPAADVDPEFARLLSEAARAGVALRGYACRVGVSGARIARRVPLRLGADS